MQNQILQYYNSNIRPFPIAFHLIIALTLAKVVTLNLFALFLLFVKLLSFKSIQNILIPFSNILDLSRIKLFKVFIL